MRRFFVCISKFLSVINVRSCKVVVEFMVTEPVEVSKPP